MDSIIALPLTLFSISCKPDQANIVIIMVIEVENDRLQNF